MGPRSSEIVKVPDTIAVYNAYEVFGTSSKMITRPRE